MNYWFVTKLYAVLAPACLLFVMTGCGDRVKPELEIELPDNGEEQASKDAAATIVVTRAGYQYNSGKAGDLKSVRTAIVGNLAKLKANGCIIKVSPDAPEESLTDLLTLLSESGVSKLNVLTFKPPAPADAPTDAMDARPAATADRGVTEALEKLRPAMPRGWTAALVKDSDGMKGKLVIRVTRDKEVRYSDPPRPNMSLADAEEYNPGPFADMFHISLEVVAYMPPKEGARRKARNKKIDEMRQKHTRALDDVPRHGKTRASGDVRPLHYRPETDAQRKRVDEYATYYGKNPKQIIPDYHFSNVSFTYDDPWWTNHIVDKEFGPEHKAVREAIESVLQTY